MARLNSLTKALTSIGVVVLGVGLGLGVSSSAYAAAASAASTASAASAAPAVDETFNPKPLEGDVLVPMPCGGVMAFRKVYTGSDGKLTDRKFNAGNANTDAIISQSLNDRYIQGAFHDDEGYYYLISKYELNEAQYQLLHNYDSGKGKCPATAKKYTVKDRIAKANLSWFDAIELTRQYSSFLGSKAASDAVGADKNLSLPSSSASGKEKAVPAFARLPTDSEWEYAARGGLEVSSSQFEADVFPLEEGKEIASYAWYKGQESSSNGRVNVIGLKDPNPLGIFDILGNVSEMMLDPFYAIRTGRLHGQSGGFIVRGGSVKSAKVDMTTAYRMEKPYFTRGKETKSNDTGMRIVLSLPFTNSTAEVAALNKEASVLGTDSDAEDVKGGGNLNTVADLDKIMAEAKAAQEQYQSDKEKLTQSVVSLQKSLSELRASMIEANAKKDEMRDRAIVSNLRLGGYLCSSIASAQVDLERTLKNEEILKSVKPAACHVDEKSEKCIKAKEQQESKLKYNRELAETMLDYYVSYYADHIADTIGTFDLKFISAQEHNAQKALGKKSGSLSDYIAQFVDDTKGYAKGGRDLDKNKKTWVKQCRALTK